MLNFAHLYYPIFLWVISIFSIVLFTRKYRLSARAILNPVAHKNDDIASVILCTLFTIIVGLRPISYHFGDTVNYALIYELMKYVTFISDSSEWLWDLIMRGFALRFDSIQLFLLFVEIVYIGCMYWTCKKLFPRNLLISLIFCMGAFSFFSYGTNGIRNGMACSMVLMAIPLIQGNRQKKIIAAVICFLALNIHRSAALPIVCILIAYLYKGKPKYIFYWWFLSILISLVAGGSVENFFANLGFDDRMTQYIVDSDIDDSQFSRAGFRWDFLLYSMMPIVLGYYLVIKRKIYNKMYLILLFTYILSNSFWVMIIRSSFSNRFAYLSWFLYPLILAYPLLTFNIWEKKQGRYLALVLLAHTGFTVFMQIIG